MHVMEFQFTAEVWYWRGPAPFSCVSLPAEITAEIKAISNLVTYGWGMIPVTGCVGETEFTTSMFFRNKKEYVLPLKDAVRRSETIDEGDTITVTIAIKLQD